MYSEKVLRVAFVIVSLSFLWSMVRMENYREKYEDLKGKTQIEYLGGGDIAKAETIDSLQNLADSLYDENFPCQIELSRYQNAYKIFMERNPKAASQYGDIISEETE